MMNRRSWTDHEIFRAKAWRKAGHTYRDIDRWLHRPHGSTASKLNYQDTTRRYTVSSALRPSPRAIAEAERRYEAASRRDLTASFFGDPPPGYSALDQKRRDEQISLNGRKDLAV